MDLISQFEDEVRKLKVIVAKKSIKGVGLTTSFGFKLKYVKDRWNAQKERVNNHVENLQWDAAYINGLKDACEILSKLIRERKECVACLKHIPEELKELL